MTYEIRKGPENIEASAEPPHDYHKPVEIKGEFSYGKDSKAYSWRSRYKCHSYGEASNETQGPHSEISQGTLDNSPSEKIYTLKSNSSDNDESGSTAGKILNNTNIPPQK